MVALSYQPEDSFSPHEYLAFEHDAETKHEYFAGQVWAMAGASTNYNTITVNTSSSIHQQLRGSSCRTFSSDQRLRVLESNLYAYPDIMVVCGEIEFDDERNNTITNPVVLIEVLSPSTEAFDRGDKWAHYQRITALRDYILISQNQRRIEHFARQNDNSWLLRTYENMDDTVTLSGAPLVLNSRDIYERVNFSISAIAPVNS